MVCGTDGVCKNSQCSCPLPENGTDYFKEVNEREIDSGCSLITPISCESSQNWHILELENDSSGSPYIGSCSLQSQFYSLMNAVMMFDAYNYSAFIAYIKVQNVSSAVPLSPRSVPSREETNHGKKRNGLVIVLGSSVATIFGLFLLIGILVFWFWKSKNFDEVDEYYLDHVPGMPTQYSFKDLQVMTRNFKKKLGAGEAVVGSIDEYSEDMQLHGAEVVDIIMMRVATWCLQNDFTKRPFMSMVDKVLDGVVDVEESQWRRHVEVRVFLGTP
ncbi:g-type lectin s-receptor-like serine/threonine-protein kinase [Quercus suber]|uniref:G-type lectin s-receptor-like serine/threonine-protein kinase n=1 Tax=Quercus suber TaxID=58331 RepID=A0AAW0IT97_QUESU